MASALMADERIDAVKGRLSAAREHAMRSARLLDELGRMDLHASMMLMADICDETSEALDQTEDAARMRQEYEAVDLDVERDRRYMRRLRVLDTESEREEARKVGRETL